MAKSITILGATGSIGTQTLDIVRQYPERYRVEALTARRNVKSLLPLCIEFTPKYACMVDSSAAQQLEKELQAHHIKTEVLSGSQALEALAKSNNCELVMAAIVGAAGLPSTIAAVAAGKTVLLANKEALVMAGELLMQLQKTSGATILPIDSEHSALFQCMPHGFLPGDPCPETIKSIVITASGGPFLKTPVSQLAKMTPEQAVAHPNWSMGKKISVDSATMMNKGLEVIEGYWLFGLPADHIEVVIHPQSIVHSMVRYHDGSLLAQMGCPDMRVPIAYALGWPDRLATPVLQLDFTQSQSWQFMPVDYKQFPCLSLAFQALREGGAMPVILNAANEVAVAAFLEKRIKFTQVAQLIEDALNHCANSSAVTLQQILHIDQQTRDYVDNAVTV
ncbi:MAG: 1-deoxy-D-xylulose-5-phosphate reductoisomerase [Gammaproteobacteria bacterium]|nr:1-deoxy-D-xylulose-5-phosphate reductoisomerase [Gammaproteobacteria bacterium]